MNLNREIKIGKRNIKVVYLLAIVFAASIALNAAQYLSVRRLVKTGIRLEDNLRAAESERARLALSEKGLSDDKKQLESRVDGLNNDIASLSSQLAAEKSNNGRALAEISAKEAEIARLSAGLAEQERLNKDMAAHISYLNSEYESLKKEHDLVVGKKKKSDKKLNKLVKDMADEEKTSSLGTVVVK
ncbi:MAG: hypothetical protein PHP46_05440 [Candidatus Omnitrophica bacterium]|nr:hypothetical protein [Candidatus Omnitrophota bacterium]